MVKPRIVLLGTGAEAPYHPLAPLEAVLSEILSRFGQLAFTTDREGVLRDPGVAADLLVLLCDDWEKPASDDAMAGLVSWVSGGGALLVLHQGLSLQARDEFSSLVGARFTGHPEARCLRFAPREAFAEAGLAAWEMRDEPYRFVLDPSAALVPLLEYEDAEGVHPAGWERRFCRGRIVYLAPGHGPENYADPAYGQVVAAAAERLLGTKKSMGRMS